MANSLRRFMLSAALRTAALAFVACVSAQSPVAVADTERTIASTSISPTPTQAPRPRQASPRPSPSPLSRQPAVAPPPTGADSSGGSINGLANQRFNQMITNRVLGTVLLGVNEQVNCSDCVSAFGSAGSFSAGIHGRKKLTPNLSLLAGIAYTQYSEGGYNITSAPIGAFALRYDFTDWGSSRPFFDIGTILTPLEKVRYTRSYKTSLGPVTSTARPRRELRRLWPRRLDEPGVAARRGRSLRRSLAALAARQGLHGPRRRVQSVRRLDCHRHRPHQPGQDRRPVDASVRHQHRNQHQWRLRAVIRHAIRHRRHRDRRRHHGADHRQPGLVRIWRPARLPHQKGWIVDLFVNGTPARSRSATPSMAAWGCGSIIRVGSSVGWAEPTGARMRGR